MFKFSFFYWYILLQISAIKLIAQENGNIINHSKNSGDVLRFYKSSTDSIKLKAANFLLNNITIHASQSYYWATAKGKRIVWDETAYPNFEAGIAAFDSLKVKHGPLHPVAITYKDADTLSAKYLIENIELAFKVWPKPWNNDVTFKDFCEYILPYRASIEPVQNWRHIYYEKYKWVQDSLQIHTIEQVLPMIANEVKSWFINTWEIEQRKEPLPRLGALQLLQRKKGPCEDMADLMVFILRSQGLVVSNEIITWWATSTGRHFCNNVMGDNGQRNRYDVSTGQPRFRTFEREPAKVIRTTYSINNNNIAAFQKQENIPPGFMQTVNFTDVTAEYWKVRNITCGIENKLPGANVVYACVFNGGTWRPTWWAKMAGSNAVFNGMVQGAAFLPTYYNAGKIIPAGWPVINGYDTMLTLKPDANNKATITIKEQEKYLIFRPGKNYKLYWWNNVWQLAGEQLYKTPSKELIFYNVPANALYLLVPEYSQGRERPFSINNRGERQWW